MRMAPGIRGVLAAFNKYCSWDPKWVFSASNEYGSQDPSSIFSLQKVWLLGSKEYFQPPISMALGIPGVILAFKKYGSWDTRGVFSASDEYGSWDPRSIFSCQ